MQNNIIKFKKMTDKGDIELGEIQHEQRPKLFEQKMEYPVA